VLLTDFCNRSYVTCTCYRSLDSRVCSVHFRSPNPTNGVASAGTPGRFAFDDATRASVDPPLTRSAIWRSRAPLNPGGLRYRWNPRRGAPRSAALSSAGEECASTSDAPCHDELRAVRRNRFRGIRVSNGPLAQSVRPTLLAARTAFPQDPVKGPDSVRSEAPSIDECPLDAPPPFRETTNLEREPATGLGALPPFNPASNALSPPRSGEEVARPRPLPCALHARALLATRRSSTSAIETICKHDLRTSKPGDAEGCSTFAELLICETGPHFDFATAAFTRR
jgi:hypothetical protein